MSAASQSLIPPPVYSSSSRWLLLTYHRPPYETVSSRAGCGRWLDRNPDRLPCSRSSMYIHNHIDGRRDSSSRIHWQPSVVAEVSWAVYRILLLLLQPVGDISTRESRQKGHDCSGSARSSHCWYYERVQQLSPLSWPVKFLFHCWQCSSL